MPRVLPGATGGNLPTSSLGKSVKVTKDGLTAKKPENKALLKACQDFESVLVSMLMKGMRKTVPQSGLTGSTAEDTFKEMLDDEYSKSIAGSGRLGIAQKLYEELSRKNNK